MARLSLSGVPEYLIPLLRPRPDRGPTTWQAMLSKIGPVPVSYTHLVGAFYQTPYRPPLLLLKPYPSNHHRLFSSSCRTLLAYRGYYRPLYLDKGNLNGVFRLWYLRRLLPPLFPANKIPPTKSAYSDNHDNRRYDYEPYPCLLYTSS